MSKTLFDHQTPSEQAASTTVAVSLYNYGNYIEECLESVAAQTLTALELVVVDDCSKDDSLERARSWMEAHADRFVRIRLLQTDQNSGLAAARNTAFAEITTPFVFILDADNALFPPCIERLEEALSRSEASFAYSYVQKFGSVSAILNIGTWNAKRLRQSNYIDAMTLMRREVWESVGGYRKMKVTGWEDYQVWLDLSIRGGRGILVPEILCRYRVHGASMLHQITMKPKNYEVIQKEVQEMNPEFFG